MQIIRRLSDNVIQYIADDSDTVKLTEKWLRINKVKSYDIGSLTHEIVFNVEENKGFKGGQFKYKDKWLDLEGNPAKRAIMTRLEFVRLFTHDEYKAIEASTLPEAINYFQEVKYGTGKVDLSADLEMEGLAFLVANNLLTQERSDEISEGVPV